MKINGTWVLTLTIPVFQDWMVNDAEQTFQ